MSYGREPPRQPPTGSSIVIRNLNFDTAVEDIRHPAEKYGRVKDVYIPKDYYTGRPRGFAFVEFEDPRDAEDAKSSMDGMTILGNEIHVEIAMRGRRQPARGPPGGGYRDRYDDRDRYRRRSYSPRRRSRSRSRSRGRRRRSRSRSYERRRRSYSRSRSRSPRRERRRDSRSRSPAKRSHSRSRSPARSASPTRSRSRSPRRSRSRSPADGRSPVRAPSHSRSRSPRQRAE